MESVACVILNYNDYKTTINCVRRLIEFKSVKEIVIVDNNSLNDSFKLLKDEFENQKKVFVISSRKNGGYGYGNNFGVKFAYEQLHADFVVIMNPDVMFSDSMIKILVKGIKKNNAALVSGIQRINKKVIIDKAWKLPKALFWTLSETRIFHKYAWKKYHYDEYHFNKKYSIVDCVPGAMIMVDPKIFKEVGGFDQNVFLFGEETILAHKLKKAGYKTVLINNAYYDHEHSVTINKNLKEIKQLDILHSSKIYYFKNYVGANMLKLNFYKLILKAVILRKKVSYVLKNKNGRK